MEREVEFIHAMLDHIHTSEHSFGNIEYEGKRLGYAREETKQLRARMQQLDLVVNHDGERQNGGSTLTPKGYQIASSPGGYKSYIAQQNATEEAKQLKAAKTEAATNRVSWINIGLTAGNFIAAAIAAYVAWQTSSDSDATEKRLHSLEAEIKILRQRP